MRQGTRLFKISLWLATTSLTVGTTAPVWAQPAPPPGAAARAGSQQTARKHKPPTASAMVA